MSAWDEARARMDLEASLSDAAVAATPAVQQYGDARAAAEAAGMVVLDGAEREAYQALKAAAVNAVAAEKARAAAGSVLHDAIRALCAAVAPGGGG